MKHYICTGGCRGVSETLGVCETDGCSKKGHSLEECDCTDGGHYGRLSGGEESLEQMGDDEE